MQSPFTKTTGLPYTVNVNRKLARHLTVRVKKATPNQVTFWGFIVLLAAIALILLMSGTIWVLPGYFLLALNYVLDSVDGQLARLKNMSSPLGEWLDHSLDGLRMILLHLAYMWVMYQHLPDNLTNIGFLAFALNLAFMTSNYFFSILKIKILNQKTGDYLRQSAGIKGAMLKFMTAPADYGFYIMISLLLVRVDMFLWAYLLYGVYFMLVFIMNFILTIRQNT